LAQVLVLQSCFTCSLVCLGASYAAPASWIWRGRGPTGGIIFTFEWRQQRRWQTGCSNSDDSSTSSGSDGCCDSVGGTSSSVICGTAMGRFGDLPTSLRHNATAKRRPHISCSLTSYSHIWRVMFNAVPYSAANADFLTHDPKSCAIL